MREKEDRDVGGTERQECGREENRSERDRGGREKELKRFRVGERKN